MRRSPTHIGFSLAAGLGFVLTLLWLLNSSLPIARATPITQVANASDAAEPITTLRPQTGRGNGEFTVSLFRDGTWQTVGALAYVQDLTEHQLDLSGLIPSGQVALRLTHGGDTAAHIDAIHLGGAAPQAVLGTSEDTALALRKLASRDYDVIDAARRTLTFIFDPPTGATPVMALTARIEPEYISQIPFQFPPDNTYGAMSASSSFYTYAFDSQPGTLTIDGDLTDENLGEPFFSEFTRPGTGHPANYTYGWVHNDDENLYVAIDFTPDNTMDGDKDYARVYVNVVGDLREFKVSVPEQQWGQPGFTYTPRAVYQHKVYEFKIPLAELGLASAQPGMSLELAFAAYGTAAPSSPCFATLDGSTVYSGSFLAVQDAVDAASEGSTVKVAGYCWGVGWRAGTYQTVYISKTLTLAGGYTLTNWTTPDPVANPTTLDAYNFGRVVYATVDVTLSNLTLQYGKVSGDGGGLYTSGVLTLTAVNVLSNTASSGGGGVYANNAVLSGGLFQNNACTNSPCYGGGLYAGSTLALTGTQFLSNTATQDGGGAIALGAATLSDGLFQNNGASWGGGLYANGAVTLTGTQFISNTATLSGGGTWAWHAATLSGGLFQNNRASWGGGLSANSTLALTGTQFLSNTATHGGGLYHAYSDDGRLVNTLFVGNAASGNGSALYLGSPGQVTLVHTTIASPTVGAGTAIYVRQGTVNITNTLVASYTTSIQRAGGTVNSDYNLFYNAPTTVTIGSHSLTGTNPLFVNPAGDDYHLLSNSPAVGAGLNVGVATDLDGQPRRDPPTIGAYEALWRIFLPLVLR